MSQEKKQRKTKNMTFRSLLHLSPSCDPWIQIAVIILVVFGTMMVISTNVGNTTTNANAVLNTTIRQCVFLVVSYFCMWVANRMFRFRWFSSIELLVIAAVFIVMLLPLGFAESGGSRAWIRLPGGFSIQPSEFAKPVLILMCACAIYNVYKYPDRIKSISKLFGRAFLLYFVLCITLFLQRDMGTLAIVSGIFFVCLLVPGYPSLARFQKWLKRLVIVSGVCAFTLFWATDIGIDFLKNTSFSHIATRIENAKDPYNDIYGDGYQLSNALYGIGSGGLFGKGIGESARKYGYLTQADNDYIFAVIVEETGIFGVAILCFGYGMLIYRLFYYAFKTNEIAFKIVLIGTASYFFLHFFLNVGGVTGLVPSTGIPLLFVSSGGSSLMAGAVTIGLCQQCISNIRIKEMPRLYAKREGKA